ncbi:MAG: hypothetical protein R3Y62_01315 [Eubacteriales bacterium]
MKKRKSKQEKTPMEAAMEVVKANMSSDTDPEGSYTGVPQNPGEIPTQDADDL